MNDVKKVLLVLLACLCQTSSLIATSPAGEARLRFENVDGAAATELIGPDARLQLLVSMTDENGVVHDLTRDATYQASIDSIVSIDPDGLVTPIRDGEVTITAKTEAGPVTTTLRVAQSEQALPIGFSHQIIPVFTKLGCNGGGCHGKIAGQNGFRLSLLGFEPIQDHKRLLAESRGRRVSIAAPERSLLLQKTINSVPHGGGARTQKDSHEYRLLRRWIAQGMPFDPKDQATLQSIRVVPEQRRLASNSSQQLAVVATYSDGRQEDITRAAIYESNDPQMAEVSETGLVKTSTLVGDVAVMARYQGQVAVFRADIPLRFNPETDTREPVTNLVDIHVREKLRSLGIAPSPPCDDATYLRRVTLDLAARLPTLEETQRFLADESPNKRSALVDRLLSSEDYATAFANKWNTVLRNRRNGNTLQLSNVVFHEWLKRSFRNNVPYNDFVHQLLTASGSTFSNPAVVWLQQVTDQSERIEDVSQLFLGQRIQCARCHHHPYEKWSQTDYAAMSAFFSTITRKSGDGETTFVSRIGSPSAKHPKTGRSIKPAGLNAAESSIDDSTDPRNALSRWITAPANPFFAKSLVNRYWKHFLGRGLVEPEDDMRVTNPPSNPQLMDALSEDFVDSGYNLHHLIRTICLSKTYGASSNATEENLIDRRSHSRFYPKRLNAEVLLDAIDTVAGTKTSFDGMPSGTRAIELPDTGFSSYFLSVFGQPASKTACECERTSEANLAQSLHLLNSEQMQSKLSDDAGRAAALAADSGRSISERVSELYLVALNRPPREKELMEDKGHLGKRENQREPWEDLIWAIVNSKEFLFIH